MSSCFILALMEVANLDVTHEIVDPVSTNPLAITVPPLPTT